MPTLAERWRNLGRSSIDDDWNDALPVVGAAEFFRGRRVEVKGTKSQRKAPEATKSGRVYLTSEQVAEGVRLCLDGGLTCPGAADRIGCNPRALKAHVTAERKRRAAASAPVAPVVVSEPCTPEVDVSEPVTNLCCCDCGETATLEHDGDSLCDRCYTTRTRMSPPVPLPPAITCCACNGIMEAEDVCCGDCREDLQDEVHHIEADRRAEAVMESACRILGAMTLDEYDSLSMEMRHAIAVLRGMPC